MPSISRVFNIPRTDCTEFPVTLHEPSLTSDNLGMKTWVSSFLLAKRLGELLTPSKLLHFTQKDNRPLRALELGAGTGLVGISFASLCGSAASVHLTDLPEIVPNLAHNVSLNEKTLLESGALVSTGVLDWSIQDTNVVGDHEKYEILLAADPLYSPDHPRWLAQTIQRWLSPVKGSRVVLEMPLRDAYLSQVSELRKRMRRAGLIVLDEGEETGHDDWESIDGSPLEVPCWWSVWAWDSKRLTQD